MVVSATLAGITIPNPYADMSDGELLVVGVLVAPVFETLLLWFLLVVAQWCVGGRVYASAALAALLVAFAHLWGSSLYQVVGVLWPFFVQGNSTLRSGTVKSACAYAFWGEVVNSSRSREYR